jgi:hypothetical protein
LAVYNLFQVLDVTESATILFAVVDPVRTESETAIFLIIKPFAISVPVIAMLPVTVPMVKALIALVFVKYKLLELSIISAVEIT